MSLPKKLDSQFELIEHFPNRKIFDCFRVKERKSKRPRELVLRLLPASLNDNQAVIDEFHGFFFKLSNLTNRSHIPIVYSVAGTLGGPVYVLEQYVSGVGLPEYIEKHRSSNTLIDDLTEIVVRVCEGLHFAHQKDIFHCCITNDDILIDPDNPRKVKLVGFGAQILLKTNHVKDISPPLTKFVAPEIASRVTIDTGCDIYSLATALSDSCPEISFWNDLLARSQSRDPLQRPASAREFGRELRKLSDTSNKQVAENESEDLIAGGLNPVLTIKTEPEGAEVWSHGNTLGITSASGLMVPWKLGTVLEIRKPAYGTETIDLSAPPDNTEIMVKLSSALTLYTNPWGASVRVNGEMLGTTTYRGITVPWDKGKIIIEKDGYNPEHFSFHAPPLDEDYSLELKPLTMITPFSDRRHFQMLAYGIGGLVLVLLLILFFGRSQNQDYDKRVAELQTQVKTKDAEIVRISQAERELKVDVERKLNDLRSQVKTKDSEIERLAQAEKNLKIDVDKQVFGLRSELSNKAAEIAKLTQADQDKSRLQSELQKQLNELKSTVLSKDRDIERLSQIEREKQQLQAQLQSLKQSSSQPPQPATQSASTKQVDHSVNMKLVLAASRGADYELTGLLAQGADPNATDLSGYTPLMMATMKGRHEMVKNLLNAGAYKNLRSCVGMTALDYAKLYKHKDIISLLNTHAEVHSQTISEGLGITIVELRPDVASKMLWAYRHSLLVRSVISDGIGAKMGLRADDVIIQVDGTTFADMVELDKLWVAATKKGVIRVKIVRGTTVIFLGGSLN
jgi:serine/threonine protein kinase